MQKKINWISILQGWAMLLVVLGHISLTGKFLDPETPITSIIQKTIYSFHMPLFMFISGMLFWETRLQKDWIYKDIIIDKTKRLLIPYIFFTILTFLLKLVASNFVVRQVKISIPYVLRMFIIPDENPLGELWFIFVLFSYFFLYPVTKIAKQNKPVFSIIVLVVSFFISFFVPKAIKILAFSQICYYYIFFFSGILFMKKDFISFMNKWYIFIISIIIFVLVTVFQINSYFIIFAGIFMSCCLAVTFDKIIPKLFFTFRDYTFQIFLFGIFFQVAVKIIYQKIGMKELYLPFYLLNVICGLYCPIMISLIIKKIGTKFLLLICGLK